MKELWVSHVEGLPAGLTGFSTSCDCRTNRKIFSTSRFGQYCPSGLSRSLDFGFNINWACLVIEPTRHPSSSACPIIRQSSTPSSPCRAYDYLSQDRKEFREFDGTATNSPCFVAKSEAKERMLRMAALSDQSVSVLQALKPSTSSVLRLTPQLIDRMAKSAGEHLGQAGLNCFYTVYREGVSTYSIQDSKTKVVTKAKLLGLYPFLWTLFLLHWCYRPEEQVASPPPSELPDNVLQTYLDVWHGAVGFRAVARRESPVAATSTLLVAPVLHLPHVTPCKPPMAIWCRIDWDLLSLSKRVI